MAEDGLNKIIKRVYAEDLELIEKQSDLTIRKQQLLQMLKEKLWTDHSSAIKVAIVSFGLAVISAGIYYYNFFTLNSYQAMQERANVEAHLQRRSDLIPNLVKSAGSYLTYEKNIFGHIAEIRGAVAGMKSLEQSMSGIQDRSVLSKFQAVAEAYPALKASEAYTTLMKELSDTETKIADSRIKYNQIANYHNSRLQMFPAVIFNTFIFRFKPLPVFESNKAPVPDVQQRHEQAVNKAN
ncbi:MAG: LemA family protein [Nitrospirae bacterium]|uniref:Magnetosome protein MamQ-I n=1 Tax=uncultured Nitrospirota bacterium TaxID=170969 RepID=A0A142BTV7_9BACT|nr:magnetosome protein MamQ-I [uncultured Nitrospirota bacterium]MBF0328601.1 LemA family protein [Nitrospirota bacterium]